MALDPVRTYFLACRAAHRDGELSPAEARLLERLREWLALPVEAAGKMEAQVRDELSRQAPSGGELDAEAVIRSCLEDALEGRSCLRAHERVLLEQLAAHLGVPAEQLDAWIRKRLGLAAAPAPGTSPEAGTEVEGGRSWVAEGDAPPLLAMALVVGGGFGGATLLALSLVLSGVLGSEVVLQARILAILLVVLSLSTTGLQVDRLIGYTWSRDGSRALLAGSLTVGAGLLALWITQAVFFASLDPGPKLVTALVVLPLVLYMLVWPIYNALLFASSPQAAPRFSETFELWKLFVQMLRENRYHRHRW